MSAPKIPPPAKRGWRWLPKGYTVHSRDLYQNSGGKILNLNPADLGYKCSGPAMLYGATFWSGYIRRMRRARK